MAESGFQSGSPLHFVAAGTCFAIIAGMMLLGRISISRNDHDRFRAFVGWGCVVVWLLNTASWMTPERFSWERSLPLHVCNIANIFGAIAVLKRVRLFQGIIYFWAIGLCIWAFLTPTLDRGPAEFGFYIFWIYHLFIGLAVVHVLVIDGFRPSGRDCRNAIIFTLGYLGVLAVIDRMLDWNYGFVGPSTPAQKTPVDALGPYPLRLLWMALAGCAVFIILWLPWRFTRKSD
jgi:hypothetical integral membrane protein (TIGR02206 family)